MPVFSLFEINKMLIDRFVFLPFQVDTRMSTEVSEGPESPDRGVGDVDTAQSPMQQSPDQSHYQDRY